ncbi:MAG: hypothetical protein ABW187_06155 [Dokdonella sp.]
MPKFVLRSLADALLERPPQSRIVGHCIEFVRAETRGDWHGRAHALMCRRLKHCTLDDGPRIELLSCIIGRLSAVPFRTSSRINCGSPRISICGRSSMQAATA